MNTPRPGCDADNFAKQIDDAAQKFLSVIDCEALSAPLRASVVEDIAEIMADIREDLGLPPRC